jgi:hypothetical protein
MHSGHINGQGPGLRRAIAVHRSRTTAARDLGTCPDCKQPIRQGQPVIFAPGIIARQPIHQSCYDRKGVTCTNQSLPF